MFVCDRSWRLLKVGVFQHWSYLLHQQFQLLSTYRYRPFLFYSNFKPVIKYAQNIQFRRFRLLLPVDLHFMITSFMHYYKNNMICETTE
jgi:hypothetical protein